MKIGSFIFHTLIFLTAWITLAVLSWDHARFYSQTWLKPWVLSMAFHPSPCVYTLATAVLAISASLLAALILLAVLIALGAIRHLLFKSGQGSASSK